MPEIATVILAAGEGKRMLSSTPKVLYPLCGRPMIDYPVALAGKVKARKVLVVTPKKRDNPVLGHLKKFKHVGFVFQEAPLGTGHAVRMCASKLNGFQGYVLILYGDDPLLTPATLNAFLSKVEEAKATLGLITVRMRDPSGYGRVVRSPAGEVLRIVEEKEATSEEKGIHEINTGIYAVRSGWLFGALKKLKSHPVMKEYYLTDIVEEAVREGETLLGYQGEGEEEFLGINSRQQLAKAEEVLRGRLVEHWMARRVRFADPRHVYLDADVTIGEETHIDPFVFLYGKTRIGRGCMVECGAVLKDMTVGDNVHIKPYCVMEESRIAKGAQVGPFARIRPGSVVGEAARVGNFVELKKAKLGPGVKANHLTYLGDAEIGAGTNVGCGTITCNYDGVKKHPTKIGKKVFVGSDVQFVAPVKIGDGAYIGAGSTITENVPAKALAIARGRQVNKKNWATGRSREARGKKHGRRHAS